MYFKKGVQLASNGTINTTFAPAVAGDWDIDTVSLSAYVGQNIKVKFEVTNRYGNNLYLDDVNINNTAGSVASVLISSNDADNIICAGQNLIFTAIPTNGGTTPSYQWKVNGANMGTNSPTYTTATLTNAQLVTCIMTSNLPGVTGSPATSNVITMSVNPIPATPTASSNSPLCAGTTINLTTPLAGGATYSWTGPSAFTSTLQNPTRPASTVAMGGIYSITITQSGCTSLAGTTTVVINPAPATPTAGSNSPVCTGSVINLTTPTVAGATYSWTGPNAFSSALQNPSTAASTAVMAGTYSVTVTVAGCSSIAGTTNVVVSNTPVAAFTGNPTSTICSGFVQFTDNSTGSITSWLWNFGDGQTDLTQSPSHTYTASGTYSVTLTATNGCGNNQLLKTNYITISVPSTPVGIDSSRCGTGTVNLQATGSGVLHWFNTPSAGTDLGTGGTYTTPSISTTTPYYVEDHIVQASQFVGPLANFAAGSYSNTAYTLNFDCLSACTLISVAVDKQTAGNITIQLTTSTGTVLQTGSFAVPLGASRVTLNWPLTVATGLKLVGPATAGLWRVNTGGIFPYTLAGLVNITSCSSTTRFGSFFDWEIKQPDCISARTIVTATINTSTAPTVSIAASPSGSICTGTSVTFTATQTNGGLTPAYQWQVNGGNVGTNASTFTSSTLTNGQIVTCNLTSGSTCAIPNTATSNAITMAVSGALTPSVSIASSPAGSICAGANVTFTATPTNGGSTPVYQWQINGANVGTNSPAYANSSLVNGDIVTCILTSNSACASPLTGTSNAITMAVNPIPVTPTASSNTPVCTGSSINLTTPTATGTYSWTGPGSFTSILQNPTRTGATAAMGGTYSVTVTSNGCTSVAGTTTMVIKTTPTVTVPSSNQACAGGVVLTNAFTSTPVGSTFAWTNSNTAIGLAANGAGNLPMFTATNPGISAISGIITVIPTLNGCVGSPASFTLTVNPLPSSAFTQSADQCLLANSFSYTNTGGTGSYSWTFAGGTPATSVSNNPTGISFATTGTHTITHTVTSAAACLSATTTSSITIFPTPSLLITNPAPVCSPLCIDITAAAVTNGSTAGGTLSYWTDANAVSTLSSSNAVCTAGTYYIQTTTTDGCFDIKPVLVSIDPQPVTPTISQLDLTLTSGSASGNQWYLDGALISGATNQNYTVTSNGVYTVVVTANGCSSPASVPVNIVNVGIFEAGNPFLLGIYPNPNDGNFNVSFIASLKSTYTLELINALGQLIFKDVLMDYTGTYTKKLSVTEYGKGVYTISLTNSKNETVKKIIVY